MQSSVAAFPAGARVESAEVKAASLPWFIYAVVLAAACIPIGALWDISWHSTIGRDSFWTPAHMMIYLGGALPGLCCGWIALKTSFFSSEEERSRAVRYLGFRAPLGAWVTIWGSLTMLVSAPFDNWWHDAYGLDVEILSPPHSLLALGMYAVAIGATLLALSWQNRGGAGVERPAGRLFVFSMGVLIAMASIILTEKSYPNAQRGGEFYISNAFIYAMYLTIATQASRSRWGATQAAAIYMLIVGGMVWILPLFKAQPLLAPIYLPVDHMVPPVFPLLLVVPAVVIDLLNQRMANTSIWLKAPVIGFAFLAVFMAVQWNFSAFLLSDAADNAFFAGGRQWPYFIKPGPWRDRFWVNNGQALTAATAGAALGVAIFKSFVGLLLGRWMSKVQR